MVPDGVPGPVLGPSGSVPGPVLGPTPGPAPGPMYAASLIARLCVIIERQAQQIAELKHRSVEDSTAVAYEQMMSVVALHGQSDRIAYELTHLTVVARQRQPTIEDSAVDYKQPMVLMHCLVAAHQSKPVVNAGRKRKWPIRCKCKGCKRDNCGTCLNCIDMVKHGGVGMRKKSCVYKVCLADPV